MQNTEEDELPVCRIPATTDTGRRSTGRCSRWGCWDSWALLCRRRTRGRVSLDHPVAYLPLRQVHPQPKSREGRFVGIGKFARPEVKKVVAVQVADVVVPVVQFFDVVVLLVVLVDLVGLVVFLAA